MWQECIWYFYACFRVLTTVLQGQTSHSAVTYQMHITKLAYMLELTSVGPMERLCLARFFSHPPVSYLLCEIMLCLSPLIFVIAVQWEYQVGPSVGIEAGDHIWCSRYLLEVINSYLFLGYKAIEASLTKKDFNGHKRSIRNICYVKCMSLTKLQAYAQTWRICNCYAKEFSKVNNVKPTAKFLSKRHLIALCQCVFSVISLYRKLPIRILIKKPFYWKHHAEKKSLFSFLLLLFLYVIFLALFFRTYKIFIVTNKWLTNISYICWIRYQACS